jgi:uncharacterized membrane protein YgcG
MSRRE